MADATGVVRSRRDALLHSAVALGGIALAVLLIWLSFRKVELKTVIEALGAVRFELLLFGSITYFASVLLRGLRWRILLVRAGSVSRRTSVEAMLVGFATNFALPGRLGEVYRADYVKGLTQISRSTVLGTIVVERVLDGLILVAMLVLATVGIKLGHHDETGLPPSLMITAAILFGAGAGGALIVRRVKSLPLPLVGDLFERFKIGLNSIDGHNAIPFVLLGFAVWALEAAALALLLAAFGLEPALLSVMLVLSASSLSTLLPTAPAFVGTYQFAYVLVFGALSWRPSLALAASITVQLAFFAPVMLIGFVLALRAYGRTFLRGGAGKSEKSTSRPAG